MPSTTVKKRYYKKYKNAKFPQVDVVTGQDTNNNNISHSEIGLMGQESEDLNENANVEMNPDLNDRSSDGSWRDVNSSPSKDFDNKPDQIFGGNSISDNNSDVTDTEHTADASYVDNIINNPDLKLATGTPIRVSTTESILNNHDSNSTVTSESIKELTLQLDTCTTIDETWKSIPSITKTQQSTTTTTTTTSTTISKNDILNNSNDTTESKQKHDSFFYILGLCSILSLFKSINVSDTVTYFTVYTQILSSLVPLAISFIKLIYLYYIKTLMWCMMLPYRIILCYFTFIFQIVVSLIVYILNHTPGGSKLSTGLNGHVHDENNNNNHHHNHHE